MYIKKQPDIFLNEYILLIKICLNIQENIATICEVIITSSILLVLLSIILVDILPNVEQPIQPKEYAIEFKLICILPLL